MGDKWCIVGDFNPVRTMEEMRGNNNIAIGGRFGPLFFVNIRIGFPSFGPCILAILGL